MTPDPSVGAGADRVLYVLATLAWHDGPLSIAALAEQTGLAQSTLYRQVALLKRWGFVARTRWRIRTGAAQRATGLGLRPVFLPDP